uniref:Potassium channel blocker pMeKTx30-1 n=1 Tax=Mesobuthus eupeus TaxID=34648 RepID=A0A088DAF5_MESEU|nr:potassium channel blocker pMeKTx30-1 [Mesobuthus eupeus]
MNRFFILLLLVVIVSHAKAEDEGYRGSCPSLGKPCNSNRDCCPYGEHCLSAGKGYFCKQDPGP